MNYLAHLLLLSAEQPTSLNLSATTITDAASVGDAIGTLSVTNGTGFYTYTLTSNPGTLFSIVGSSLEVAALLTAGSDSITIKADNGSGSVVSKTFIIMVTASGIVTRFFPLKIGGGGAIVGHQFALDGTMVCRTDTLGAYVRDAGTTTVNQQFLTTTAMPSADILGVFGSSNLGVYSVAIAPSDSNRIYFMFNGRIYKSTDKGVTFARTNWTQVTADPNTSNKGFGNYMAVDPVNPDVVFAGTPADGLWKTSNGGATWVKDTAVGTATSLGGHLIAFDPSSTVSGTPNATQGIYTSTYGAGIYHSTNGGSSWTLLNTSGMPTDHSHLIVTENGTLFMTRVDGTGTLHKYASGAWSAPSVGSSSLRGIASKPGSPNTVYVHEFFDKLHVTTDNGANWVALTVSPSRNAAADEPTWLTTTVESMSSSNIAFDPSQTNTLYLSEGIGMWYATPGTSSGAAVAWNSQNKGIEQLDSYNIVCPPGGSPVGGSYDRAIFKRTGDLDVYPTNQQWDTARSINRCLHLDYCYGTPAFIATLTFSTADACGYSSDGGDTWTKFTSSPMSSANDGGSISVNSGDITNMVYGPNADGVVPKFTTNKGVTPWSNCTFPAAVPTTGVTGWGHNQAFNHIVFCADRVTTDVFYAYNVGIADNGGLAPAGVYKSTDKGANFSLVSANGNLNSFGSDFFNCRLKSVPGHAGHLCFSTGTAGSQDPEPGVFFRRSTDGGATWSAVSAVKECLAFGFGAPKPGGGGYPAVFVAAYVGASSEYGIWRSDDFEQATPTWTKLTNYPFNWFDCPMDIDGDKDTYGRLYIGFINMAFAYGKIV